MYLTEGKFWYYFFSIHETILENWRNKSKTSAQFNEQQINCNFIIFFCLVQLSSLPTRRFPTDRVTCTCRCEHWGELWTGYQLDQTYLGGSLDLHVHVHVKLIKTEMIGKKSCQKQLSMYGVLQIRTILCIVQSSYNHVHVLFTFHLTANTVNTTDVYLSNNNYTKKIIVFCCKLLWVFFLIKVQQFFGGFFCHEMRWISSYRMTN